MFVDQIRVFAKAGEGGSGCMSFRREKFVPRGGPDGGDGGNGGDIILRADPQVDNLVSFFYEPHIRAKSGGRGHGKNMYGKAAPHNVVSVPVGTLIYRLPQGETISYHGPVSPAEDESKMVHMIDFEKEDAEAALEAQLPRRTDPKNLELVADLCEPGQEVILCKGGLGGKGNVHFKSSRNRTPTEFQPGQPGEEGYFFFELRTIADVGLVGYPNAGKSTLISKLTAAHPRVAAYPFTTLHPFIGIMDCPGYQRITIADIPGIIEGAHRGVGLGHDFLRHIVRCKLLLFVLDMAGSEGRSPLEDFQNLRREITLYDPTLGNRPTFVVANKMDLPQAQENLHYFKTHFPKFEVIPISAQANEGLQALQETISQKFLNED